MKKEKRKKEKKTKYEGQDNTVKGAEALKNTYEKIHSYFSQEHRLQILKFVYKKIPMFMAVSYLLLLGYLAITWDIRFILSAAVPAFVFLSVTAFRKLFNRPRPYEVMELPPLIPKDKKGESFPSRHCASAFIIAGAFLYVNIYAGIAFFLLAAAVALSRVFAGVHFISDVAAAFVYACAFSTLFFILPAAFPCWFFLQ